MLDGWQKQSWSKRLILSAVARIDDPLGLINASVGTKSNVLVWFGSLTWDEQLMSSDLMKGWLQWYRQVQKVG